jgi:hypothetical protein
MAIGGLGEPRRQIGKDWQIGRKGGAIGGG